MWQGEAQSRCRCGSGEPSPDADVAWGEPSPRCRCGSGERSPGADVEGASPVPVQMWPGVSPVPVQMCQGRCNGITCLGTTLAVLSMAVIHAKEVRSGGTDAPRERKRILRNEGGRGCSLVRLPSRPIPSHPAPSICNGHSRRAQ